MSNAEKILKEHICDSCYDETLHNLVNTPVEQVESAMQAHTNQTLQELKEKVEKLKNYGRIQSMNDKVIRKSEVLQLIDEAINE